MVLFTIAARNWLKADGDNTVAVITGLLNTMSWLFLALFIIAQVSLQVLRTLLHIIAI